MRATRARWWTVAAGLLVCGFGLGAAPDESIPYPVDYREWSHVKSALVGPQSPAFATEGGLHHIYANRPAREGYRTGVFPEGSIIVYELLATREDAGVTSEGAPRRVDVMVKDPGRYSDGGGWGFFSFKGGDRTNGGLATHERAACVSCHGKRRDHDYVHSEFRR